MNADELKGLSILVVDDMTTNRQVLQVFLVKQGCRVLLAADGQQAIEICQRECPDLVLMDVMMPVMDGYEATRRIKAATSDRWLPVVFLSALDKEENLVAGLEAGGDDYLAKPVNFVVLHAKLCSLLRAMKLQRNLDEARRWNEGISNSIDDCLITIDESACIQSVNAAVTRTFGYQPEELIGRNVGMLMPDPTRGIHDDYVHTYVAGAAAKIIGVSHRRVVGLSKGGTSLQLELGITEMYQNGRRLFVGIMRDIGDRLAAETALREHAAALQRYHDERETENALAGEILARLLQREGLKDPHVSYWLAAASAFSGDIVAACRSPKGHLYAMLADGTGHGLAAAISQLPVLTTFYALAEQDYPLGFVAYEVNRQLLAFMPTGRFVAATMICLDAQAGKTDVWLGGMPDLLLVGSDGKVTKGLVPSHLPLGIIDFEDDSTMVKSVVCPADSQLVLISDGLSEALNVVGEPFGIERLCDVLSNAPQQRRLDAVRRAVAEHQAGVAVADDISILLIDCGRPAL